jgi:hypothetical protein
MTALAVVHLCNVVRRAYLRAMQRLILSLLLLLSATAAAPVPEGMSIIRATPMAFDSSDVGRGRAGDLQFLGGWRLDSRDPRFGGLSAMAFTAAGRLTAVGDQGTLFHLDVRGAQPTGSVVGALPAGPGKVATKATRDAESMTVAPDGRLWIGFEAANAVWRYAPGMARGEEGLRPEAMRAWPGNTGPEAMARLADGRFLVLCEACPGKPDGTTSGLLFPGDPVAGGDPVLFRYRLPPGYQVTDAALLPDGRVILLHRRFRILDGVSAIVAVADPAEIRAGEVWEAREIARLAPPLAVDNMEAVAVAQESGETILWIASDDNFNPLQRTLLLKFRLASE